MATELMRFALEKTMNTQTKAIELAAALSQLGAHEAATELRRLDAVEKEYKGFIETLKMQMNAKSMLSKPPERPSWFDTPWTHLLGVPGTPLEELNLTLRTLSCIKAEGLETVEQLLTCKENTLMKFPNLGRKSLNEIREALTARGLELKK